MLELFTNEFTILIFAAILSVISPVKGLFFSVLGLLVGGARRRGVRAS